MKLATIRTFSAVSVLAGVLTLAPEAHADGPTAPSFSALPVGRVTSPPRKKIAFVGARETVPGIFVTLQSEGIPAGQHIAQITADPRIAAGHRANGSNANAGFDASADLPAACISAMHELSLEPSDGEEAFEWDESVSTETHAFPRMPDNPSSGVTAVHVERIVDQGSSVMLESVDAWVDPATRGVRQIAKTSLPLALVSTPGFGVKVYAGRDERADGRRFVQFVVVRPQTSHMERTSQMWSMRLDGTVSHSAGCGHQRVAIPVEGTGGNAATIVGTVLLPALDANGKELPPPPPSSKPTAPLSKFGPKFRASRLAATPSDPSARESELRTRMMHVQVSVSQTSKAKEPLVSVSASWGGRDQVERFVEPVTVLTPL